MANTTRPNLSDSGKQKLENYKKAMIAEGYTGYELDDVMDQAYEYVLNNEKRKKEEEERDAADKEMTNKKLDSKDENLISEYEKSHRFYMFKKAVTQAYKSITGNYPKKADDYTFAQDMTDANPESAATIHDYLSGNNVTLKDVMRDLNLENSTTKYGMPESDGSIFHEVTSAGRSGEEWSDKFADWVHADTVPAYEADAKGEFGKQFVKNLGNSAWNIAGDTIGMVANPFDSLKGLKDMVAGLGLYGSKALHDLVMGESSMEDFLAKAQPEGWYDLPNKALNAVVDPEEAVATVDAMKDYLVQRYGSIDAIANTFYEDPFGVVRDAKDALRGFTGVAKKSAKGAKVVNAINKLDDKYNPATRIEKGALKGVNKAVEGISETSLNDIKNIPYSAKKGFGEYAQKTKESMGLLSPEEKMQIQNNPYAGKQIQEAIDQLKTQGQTKTPEQIYDSMVQKYVKEELVPELEKIIDNVSDEGEVYGRLDQSGIRLKGNNFKETFDNILKDRNICIDSEGKLDFTKQHRMAENSDVINKIYKQINEIANRGEDITVDEFRTLRGLIGDEAVKAGKNTDTGRMLLSLRDKLNENAHNQLPILGGLDEVFSKNATKARELKKGLVDKEGNIKPEAVARETKKTGKSTGLSSAEQLEELLPGHMQKMEGLNMTLNLLKKYKQGETVTNAMQGVGRGVGHAVGLITGGGIWGIAGGYIGDIAGKKLGQYILGKRDIDWSKTLSELNEEGVKRLKEINAKVEAKGVLSAADKAKVDEILGGIKETKAIQRAERKAAVKADRAAAKQAAKKAKTEEANKKFKSDYDKYRGVDQYSKLASLAKTTSPSANSQYDARKNINQQFLNRKK